ncbi:hypothetical protein KIPB_003646 [Kipferlia bialata]|uniref:Uncharacterized protein n=1 Tax=Kipferlia bialata TaxID=797122 RepID=A0A9K3CSH4_9EUKA|nr:hypothetical protein KIPB_003646 [Kipferlia bialata]|eukprot:g3646.t1
MPLDLSEYLGHLDEPSVLVALCMHVMVFLAGLDATEKVSTLDTLYASLPLGALSTIVTDEYLSMEGGRAAVTTLIECVTALNASVETAHDIAHKV